MKLEVSLETYNGNPFVSIWELDQNGVRFKPPIISFGKKKFLAILEKSDEIKQLLGLSKSPNDKESFIKDEDIPF